MLAQKFLKRERDPRIFAGNKNLIHHRIVKGVQMTIAQTLSLTSTWIGPIK